MDIPLSRSLRSDDDGRQYKRMMTEAGQKLGPYEILGKLGDGGMGVVFRAWDERLHREVAIKLLHGNYDIPDMRERFLQEARAASGLNHPNICTVFDMGEQDGDLYLVMELLAGETLRERISRGALTAEEIVTYGREIAEALEVAHSKGIVHRDIKPANIFLVNKPNGKSQAKVLDFGLAMIDVAALGGWASRSLDMSVAGSTVGTLAYMSPEQARGITLDARSDLFAVGVVLYEMATLQVPFRGATSALILAQLFDHEPDSIRNWNDSIPKELERIILRLLEKDRRERFQTAKELQDALRKISGKMKKGGWLKKGAAVVPLVNVSEPVARERRPARVSSGARLIHAAEARGTAAKEEADPFAAISSGSSSGAKQVAGKRLARRTDGRDAGAGAKSQAEKTRGVTKWAIVAMAIIAALGGIFLLARSGRLHPVMLAPTDRLLLTKVQNRTGDAALDGSVLEGLEIELKQSPFLNVSGDDAYYAGLSRIESESGETAANVSSRRVAHDVGAKAYLYGEIRRDGAGYAISVDVLNTESNDKMSSVVEIAPTREEIVPAIGRVANAIRREMGEGAGSIAGASVPLEQEGTEDLDALHDYALGEVAMQRGRIGDEFAAYRRAVVRAPRFTQAQMRLAWLYGAEKAEVASASAAGLALEGAKGVDEKLRLLAEFCYEINASGDYGRAIATIRQYVHQYPRDVEGMVGLARALRVQGNLVEALLAAQQAYEEDPYVRDAYDEAELAMIGLNRFDSVLQLESQARRLGVTPSKKILAAAYLAGKQDVVEGEIASINGGERSYAQLLDKGLYLDNSGQMAAGLALWKTAASEASGMPELASTRAYLLGQSALNRAITGDCREAKTLAGEAIDLPHGPAAWFHAGMAVALCGDQGGAEKAVAGLKQEFPQSTAVEQYYVPELRAAKALAAKTPIVALELLGGAAPYDQLSLTPYLMGLAHVAEKQVEVAAVDFETVLGHRGSAFVMGGTVYPMAAIGLARASAAAGDRAKSSKAYQQFGELWDGADRSRPLLKAVAAKGR